MFKVLVAEDDAHAAQFLSAALEMGGFEVDTVPDGAAALDAFDGARYDLLVTDVMMPALDGYRLTETLRAHGYDLPILMCTAKERPAERRQGFIVGTDDYICKPVDLEELVLRCRALLRRARIVSERRIRIGEVELDYEALAVSRPGEEHVLPPKEFYLLYKLLAYPGQVFTRLQLMDEIWGMDSESDASTVNVHMNRLRRRFGDWDEFELVTVRGLGYKAVRRV